MSATTPRSGRPGLSGKLSRGRFRSTLCAVLAASMLLWTVAPPLAMAAEKSGSANETALKARTERVQQKRDRLVTQEEREAAAARMKLMAGVAGNAEFGAPTAIAPPGPGGIPDYFGNANWAFSPALRKFVDTLPGLGSGSANNLGQFIPVGKPDTITYPGSDYYEIELRQFTEKMHSDMPSTTLRGYVQVNKGTDGLGANTLDPDPIHYLGPFIVARKDRPVRIKFTNKLPTGAAGDLFLPVDTTVMGAGEGPDPNAAGTNYTQNRGSLHLHGGITPWISDGTPHQWITPADENTPYPKGVSVRNVPDMPDPGDGSTTLFYTNQQSARLMFYHDHSYGITRLNVYAGEAAGYMIQDPVEDKLVADGVLPADQVPLIIQDKTFVDASTITSTDPTWNWGMTPGTPNTGDLWYPHVYSPAQNPADPSGMNAYGRWHYGPWFWPPTTNITHPPVPNPYYDPVNAPWEPALMPGVPNPSIAGEAFMDTAMVNGTAFPTVELDPKSYRFRILNAADDRFFNLQMYEADGSRLTTFSGATEVSMVPASTTQTYFPETWPTDGRGEGVPDPRTSGPEWIQVGSEGGFLPAPAVIPQQPIAWNMDPTTFNFGNVSDHSLLVAPAERADVVVDLSEYAGKTLILYNDAPAAFPARDARLDYYTDSPDLTDTGGYWGTQAGYGPNTRTVMQIKVTTATPEPAFDLAALEDAFRSTATTEGVFESGQHPVIVPEARYNGAYNDTFSPDPFVRIFQHDITFETLNHTVLTLAMKNKAIQDEMGEAFDLDYGRMSGKLGLELPSTNAGNQNFVLQNFIDPPTEFATVEATAMAPVQGDGTQIWKITHNGVDTHPIHFHLFDVQMINRVGWDNGVRPPDDNELGWKDTIRVSPLEDTIVALRPILPKLPFGIPDSVRPLDPTQPLGSTMGFSSIDPNTGQPIEPPQTNELVNFGWEYVWHCHILSHEEMDMMRPVSVDVTASLPGAFAASATVGAPGSNVSWTDPTPASNQSSWGDLSGEIGYRVQRAVVDSAGVTGPYSQVATALANQITYADTAATPATVKYRYRAIAFNQAGETVSSAGVVGPMPTAPTSLVATYVAPSQVRLTWNDTSAFETGFVVERAVVTSSVVGTYAPIATPGLRAGVGSVTYTDSSGPAGYTYAYRVMAVNEMGASGYSNVAQRYFPVVSKRISGADRYEVAVASAQEAFPGWAGVTDVVIVNGVDTAWADAMSAAGLAGAYNGPLLTVQQDAVPNATRNALLAMPSTVNVHIVGGTGSVSSGVASTLDALSTVGTVDRVAGANRYEVAGNVAAKMKTILGSSMPTTGIIVSGSDYNAAFDAVAASPVAYKNHFPILLVTTSTVPAATTNAKNSLPLTTLYIVGGTGTVNESVRTALGIPAGNRISGANRYSTAVALANRSKTEGWLTFNSVGISSTVSDSLTGGTMMGVKGGPMLFTATTVLSADTRNFLIANKAAIKNAFVFGGTGSVPDSVKNSIDFYLQ